MWIQLKAVISILKAHAPNWSALTWWLFQVQRFCIIATAHTKIYPLRFGLAAAGLGFSYIPVAWLSGVKRSRIFCSSYLFWPACRRGSLLLNTSWWKWLILNEFCRLFTFWSQIQTLDENFRDLNISSFEIWYRCPSYHPMRTHWHTLRRPEC